MPTPRARPPRVIRLRVRSKKNINAKVASMEMGMARAITTVLRTALRKNSRIRTARPPPYITDRATLVMER